MEIYDIDVLHLRQDVNLLLDVLARDAATRRFQSFLFDEFRGIFGPGRLLNHAVDVGKLAAVKQDKLKVEKA
jgi:hypothetical protein